MALNRRQTIIWTKADRIHWRIYAARGKEGVNLGYKNIIAFVPITDINSVLAWHLRCYSQMHLKLLHCFCSCQEAGHSFWNISSPYINSSWYYAYTYKDLYAGKTVSLCWNAHLLHNGDTRQKGVSLGSAQKDLPTYRERSWCKSARLSLSSSLQISYIAIGFPT